MSHIWKVTAKDIDLAARIQNSYDRLYSYPPKQYRFWLSDETTRFLPEKNEINFVIGSSLEDIQGYAVCEERQAGSDIGAVSMLDSLRAGTLMDFNGKPVTRETLKQYDGYSEYTGAGNVLYIGLIEAFAQRQGIGRALVNHMQSLEYELIELEANSINAARFFQACGFVDTGIDAEQGEQLVMVWKNPKYSSR